MRPRLSAGPFDERRTMSASSIARQGTSRAHHDKIRQRPALQFAARFIAVDCAGRPCFEPAGALRLPILQYTAFLPYTEPALKSFISPRPPASR
jgi:hypothetical protein